MEQNIIAAAVELITDGHCNSDTIGAEDALQSYLYGSAHDGYEAECEYVESLDTIGYAQLVQAIRQNAARQIEQSIPKCTCDQPDQDCRCGSCYRCQWHDQAAYNVHRLFFGG